MNVLATTMLLGGLTFAATGFRCPLECEWGKDPAAFQAYATEKVGGLLESAGIDETRRARIATEVTAIVPEVSAAAKSYNDLLAGISTAWRAESPDANALHALVDEWSVRMGAAGHAAADALLATHAELSADERADIAGSLRTCSSRRGVE